MAGIILNPKDSVKGEILCEGETLGQELSLMFTIIHSTKLFFLLSNFSFLLSWLVKTNKDSSIRTNNG